jgi:hypothetical protein
MKTLLPLVALALTAGCQVIPEGPNVVGTPVAQGTAVPLRQPVAVGDLVVTPWAVKEDSRCPINARCVWAGRLVVTTRIHGQGWRDTADIQLGETYGTHDRVIALVSGEPGKTTDRETQPGEYRFAYEAR